jgi:23S rRNA (adenine2030-N6)-methyltransferase
MNYRHAFHAGNFADVVKHAALAQCLMRLARPLHIIDTHAGAGMYDLAGEAALKSREAQAGIVRLAADPSVPAAFAPLLNIVRGLNSSRAIRNYPGSPALICALMGPVDRLTACELRGDDYSILWPWLGHHCPRSKAMQTDGFAFALQKAGTGERVFVLIDPPFEVAGDYERTADVGLTLAAKGACVMIWLPLKDLETFDRFLRRLEAGDATSVLIAELRLRPLVNPMAMNGCALVFLNAPAGLELELDLIFGWAAQSLGETGAMGRVWPLS